MADVATSPDLDGVPALEDPAVVAALIEDLAKLDPIDYDRRRIKEAERLGIRVTTLDGRVESRRGNNADKALSGEAVVFKDVKPWPEPVDGAELLEGLAEAIRRFLALPSGAAEAMALWTLHAHCHDISAISPVLALTSPERRCGKTTALRIFAALVPRALPTSNITAAALFRAIDKWRPTVLIDEADTFIKGDDTLIGVLNSGHCRETAQLIRNVGEDHEPRAFRTWAPKIVALIGQLPSTLEDRSIVVAMRRRRQDEAIERFREARRDSELATLARRCARWTIDHRQTLAAAEPKIPDSLHDRAADNWEPLLAIADLAGGVWPELARQVALRLSGDHGDEMSVKVTLLRDIQTIFHEHGTDRLPSATLCDALARIEESPWPEWRHGRPITVRQLAGLLKGFAIAPSSIRLKDRSTPKGYTLATFADAFSRYLPARPATPPHQAEILDVSRQSGRHTDAPVADRRARSAG